MTDTERALQVLIHDVRTPVGVAQGYVRLLREERLDTPDERDRALVRTLDALSRIARLCDDANAFLPVGEAVPWAAVAVLALVTAVEPRARDKGFVVDRTGVDSSARVRMRLGTEQAGDAIAILLTTVLQPASESTPTLRIATRASELEFVASPTADAVPSSEKPEAPFDCWTLRGLAIPAACHVVTTTGGRVWRADRTLGVAFPLDTQRS